MIENGSWAPQAIRTMKAMLEKKNVNIEKLCEQYKVASLEELTSKQYSNILERLNG
jgi:hypothetical protein